MVLHLIKNKIEHVPLGDINRLPKYIRGIYALFKAVKGKQQNKWKQNKKKYYFNVVYVGMSEKSIRSRLKTHRKHKSWTHCSIFEVWDNVPAGEIRELEGILRHIYKDDKRANQLNAMKSFKAFKRVSTIKLLPTRVSS